MKRECIVRGVFSVPFCALSLSRSLRVYSLARALSFAKFLSLPHSLSFSPSLLSNFLFLALSLARLLSFSHALSLSLSCLSLSPTISCSSAVISSSVIMNTLGVPFSHPLIRILSLHLSLAVSLAMYLIMQTLDVPFSHPLILALALSRSLARSLSSYISYNAYTSRTILSSSHSLSLSPALSLALSLAIYLIIHTLGVPAPSLLP